MIVHINIWVDYQQEEKEELSLSSIDTVFPSDWGTYGDLACHKLAFFTSIHLFSHIVFWDMFKNTFQSGFLSILYSIGSKPLQIWDKKVCLKSLWKKISNDHVFIFFIFKVRNGHIKRITDNEIQSLVLEIVGTNVSTTYITCPADPKKTLGIKLPFLVMIIKNLKKYFTFEVQVRKEKFWGFYIYSYCFRFLMIEMFVVVFVLVIINQQHV